MSKLTINWPDRVAEEFPLPDSFTYEEMALVKRITGLRAGELVDAMIADDSDVAVAYAAIALRRSGQGLSDFQIREQLNELVYGSIEIDWTKEEAADGPPADAGAPGGQRRGRSRARS